MEMEIEATPWHETRSLISPRIEMLQKSGSIQFLKSFLKDESPKTTTPPKRFIHYDANYVKYCFLKEFYQLLFDGVRQEAVEDVDKELITLVTDVVVEFAKYCQEQSLEEDARELFRTFCKIHLFT